MRGVHVLSEDILYRISSCRRSFTDPLTPTQRRVDEGVASFVGQASDPRCLAALTAGGLAYRLGKWATLGVARTLLPDLPTLVRSASSLVGVGVESLTFMRVSRSLNPHLPSSFLRDFGSTFLSFGLLRGSAFFSQGQNLFLQHLFTDVTMVGTHQIGARLGWTPKPEGSLGDQLIQAEALNWQMKAGMALTHHLAPGLHSVERTLDLSARFSSRPENEPPFQSRLALAESGGTKSIQDPRMEKAGILMMSRKDGEEPFDGDWTYRTMSSETLRIRGLMERAETLREGMMKNPSVEEKRRILQEYRSAANNFPPHFQEIYWEAGRWHRFLVNASNENGMVALEAYSSVVLSFPKEEYFVTLEARNLMPLFLQAQTQPGRWRILRAIEILSPRFGDGDSGVYETAEFVRNIFSHKSAHTQRQALVTYKALAEHFLKGHKEVILGDRELRRIFDSLDPKTREIGRDTLNSLERRLPLLTQFQRFGRRLLNFHFLTRDPKI